MDYGGGGGGAGGGAIEINAVGSLTLAGILNANGGHGGLGYQSGSGGAGGGILLAGNRVTLTTSGMINANGGGGAGTNAYNYLAGGGGGGGRVTIQTVDPNGFSNGGIMSVKGGAGFQGFYIPDTSGGVGVITVNGRVTNTPAPGSLLVMAAGLAGGAVLLKRKRG